MVLIVISLCENEADRYPTNARLLRGAARCVKSDVF